MPEQGLSQNSYHWRIHDAVPPQGLERLLERFPALESVSGVRVLKTNHFRTVFHVPAAEVPLLAELAPGGCIAKVYRYTSRWDRIRYRWIRHRAGQEWHALQRFRDLGLPTARPIALVERREGRTLVGGGLVASYLAGTSTLVEALHAILEAADPGGGRGADSGLPPAAAALLERAGKLVRALHDKGVWHRDLHSGNVLCEPDGPLHLIDLHTCVFLPRLARWQRRAGFAKLVHSLRLTVPPGGLRLLLEAYGPEGLERGRDVERVERRLFSQVERIHSKRIRSRSKRCFLPSTLFAVERKAGIRLYHQRRLPEGTLEPLWSTDPPRDCLKRSAEGWVAAVRLEGEALCVKHRRYTILEGLQSLFESHRLRRAYAAGHALRVRGIATPRVIALRERRVLGMAREAHLVTEWIEDAAPLDEHVLREYWGKKATGAAARRKRILATAVGAYLRTLHDAGFSPHDLAPQNLLVSRRALESAEEKGESGGPLLLLADLDHIYLWKPLLRRGRLGNLASIGNLPEGHVSTADRLRALHAYAREDSEYRDRGWIAALRARLLEEHLRVLETLGRRDGARWAAPADRDAVGREAP
ncbi:MAG TPA: lipopolysaccharide kinase InaA family protein [Planctomycetota bacterium]|nr:lipopolysaccharide kinase InaA family protein [Planctomycetota bacterium]